MPEQEPSLPQNEIARLNDQFRTTFRGGIVHPTTGIQALPDSLRQNLFAQVMTFDDFTEDNDPYGQHDFGIIKLAEVGSCYWKIDAYDLDLQYGSEDPADPSKTTRVLTIMLADEY